MKKPNIKHRLWIRMYYTVHLGTLWTEMGDNSQMIDQDNRQILSCPKIINTNGHSIREEESVWFWKIWGNFMLHKVGRSWAVSKGQVELNNKVQWFKWDYCWGAGLPSVAVDGESHQDSRLTRQQQHKDHISMLAAVRWHVACVSTELISSGCSEPINT